MSAATIIAQAFGEGADLYKDVLGIEKDATAAQLRKAYYKNALLYHPDKQQKRSGTEEEAKVKFQAISVTYEILKDPEKRAEYDESGELVDDEDFECNRAGTDMWRSYFAQIFGKISTSDIDNFAAKYKCSEEEEQDVLKYYQKFKGDLDKMLDCVMLSNECDKTRWVEDFIEPAIQRGEVEDYSGMLAKTQNNANGGVADDMDETETEESESDDKPMKKRAKPQAKKKDAPKKAKSSKAKMKRQEKEAAEAEALMSKIRNKNAVAHRQAGFEDMLSSIKGKYGVQEPDPLCDKEFERIQARLDAKRSQRGKKKVKK